VAVDGAGNVYVVDANNYRVQKFDSSGSFITAWGSSGAGPGQFNLPRGLGLDAEANVYVADSANHRIQKFDPAERSSPSGEKGSRGGWNPTP
jgi:tripartite motif-containing protein 71